jgi:alpha-L-rhamnosidase
MPISHTLMFILSFAGAFVLLAMAVPVQGGVAVLRPERLRCEYKADPLGLDVREPRLSWILTATDPDARDQRQSAYQILVASDPAKLKADDGDLWNSGRVEGDQTAHIVYAGSPLRSEMVCWWKVRSWDGEGNATEWSEPAVWTMGLLEPADWKAKWIGYDEPEQRSAEQQAQDQITLAGLNWIWPALPDEKGNHPKERAIFRKRVTLEAGKPVQRAWAAIAVDNTFEMAVNGKSAGAGTGWHTAAMLDITDHVVDGDNVFTIAAFNSEPSPAGLAGKIVLLFEGGTKQEIVIDESWKTTRGEIGGWQLADLDDSGWGRGVVIKPVGAAPWGMPKTSGLHLPPPPYLRNGFALDRPIRRATLYASALGLYEIELNGQPVGDHVLAPGWTDYHKRVYYVAYDVTKQLIHGDNAIGAALGDGWYSSYFGFKQQRDTYGDKPRLLVQINIEFEDGTTQSIVTDNTWKASYGPLREGDIYMGTAYDARLAMPGWSSAGFDDRGWRPVAVTDKIDAKLEAHPAEPPKRIEEIAAKEVRELAPGRYIFNLGQNMVGWVRLKVNAPAGTKLTIRHAEMLNPDGTLSTTALRFARATDFYTTKGTGEEVWEPAFTFHGFQYVEVDGLPYKPSTDAITGVVVHTPMERTGHFECSNPLVNQLFSNIIWGQKGNYLEVPTDCPQRDERMGWTGDAQVFIRTGSYNFDVGAFFTKWHVDLIEDSQSPEGAFPSVAPELGLGHGATAWADAGIICPWTLYKVYGDTRTIEVHYDRMKRYIEHLHRTSNDFVRGAGPYGDWLHLGGGASSEVIGTAYFEHVTRLMAEMAAAIGRDEDTKQCLDLADSIRQKFIDTFVTPEGGIKDSSQTGFALAFSMNLLPDEIRAKAAENFTAEIEKRNWHLATGFVGTARLMPALDAAGLNDVAYKLLMQEQFPSWLFQVKLGATTMWERWDGWTPEKGFQDPGMNSFNHYAFGAVGQWLYTTVAGIDLAAPGFKQIRIAPRPGGGLTQAKASYDSMNGRILSDWSLDGDALTLRVTIPPNTRATVYVPSTAPQDVRAADGTKPQRTQEAAAVYELGSGTYEFTSPWRR